MGPCNYADYSVSPADRSIWLNEVLIRGGSTLGPGGTGPPPNVGQAPQIFWLQQQKYALLKSGLFLYSGEINTRIN